MPIILFNENLADQEIPMINRELFIVCPAVNGLTSFNVFAKALNIERNEIEGYIESVNRGNAPLAFPRLLPIMALPLSIYEGRNDYGMELVFENHFQDCFNHFSNIEYQGRILYIFENRGDFDAELAESVLLRNWIDTLFRVEYIVV